jgi:hypothetical protein
MIEAHGLVKRYGSARAGTGPDIAGGMRSWN